ncbi:MAG: HypC/HybG/HupF family hydrogenase formation chaperone [Kiritimatiellae bacterium]|nr:HypC/HybG/HupF family hydrogenase formation chaperone [Kiritimatiellia bacterium]
MCLGVPMQVLELRAESRGLVDLDGTRLEVDLSLVEDPQVGDYVIVHAGFAIERLDRAEADARIRMFEDLAAAQS